MNHLNRALYAAMAAAVVVRAVSFGSVPAGFNIDELGSAYDAWCLVNSGTDRYGISWPAYFTNYGTGQNALYAYLCAFFIWLFGFNAVAIRLPALVVSLLSLVYGVKIIGLIRRDDDEKTGCAKIVYALLYAFSPYCFMASRFGLESNLMFGISTAFLYFFIRAVNERRTAMFFIAGTVGGILLYSYAISYVVLPLFLAVSLVYLVYVGRAAPRRVAALALPLFVFALPLILTQYVNFFEKETFKFGFFSIVRLHGYRIGEITCANMMENLFLTIKSALFYDWLDYNTVPGFWTFYPMSAVFACMGMIKAAKSAAGSVEKREWSGISAVVIWFFAEVCVGMLLGESGAIGAQPNANKINGVFFAVMMFITMGICEGLDLPGRAASRLTRLASWATAALYLGFALNFFHFYFSDYQPRIFWNFTYPEIVENIRADSELSERPLYVGEDYIYYLSSALPLPGEIDIDSCRLGGNVFFKAVKKPEDLPEDAVYICDKHTYKADVYKDVNGAILLFGYKGNDALINAFKEGGYRQREFERYIIFYK